MSRISEMKNLLKIKNQQSQEKKKAEYHEKYHKFKEEGHPFWPDVIFEDTIAIVLVLGVLIALILINGVPLGNVADPGSKEFVPRPEWYFLFLFQLLKYFPGSIEWAGIIGVPSAIIILLLLIPFLDREKRPAKAGISLNTILKAGAILSVFGVVFLTFKAYETSPPTTEQKAEIHLTSQEQFGRNIFKAQGCLSCHVLAGEGKGIPLDGIGSRMAVDQIHLYVENPQEVNPSSAMPAFIKSLTHNEVEAVARYVSHVSTAAATPPSSFATPKPPAPVSTPGPVPAVIPQTSAPSSASPKASVLPAATPSPASPSPTSSGPPDRPKSHTDGRTACLICHEQGIGGAPKIPTSGINNHSGRTNDMCPLCHKLPQS